MGVRKPTQEVRLFCTNCVVCLCHLQLSWNFNKQTHGCGRWNSFTFLLAELQDHWLWTFFGQGSNHLLKFQYCNMKRINILSEYLLATLLSLSFLCLWLHFLSTSLEITIIIPISCKTHKAWGIYMHMSWWIQIHI